MEDIQFKQKNNQEKILKYFEIPYIWPKDLLKIKNT